MNRYLPLDLPNARITADDNIAVLGYASANRTSIDAVCQELQDAPSANRLREVLAQTLRFVKRGKRLYHIAIDLTLITYHGKCYAGEKEMVGG